MGYFPLLYITLKWISLFHFVFSIFLFAFVSCHKDEVLCYQLISLPYLHVSRNAGQNQQIYHSLNDSWLHAEWILKFHKTTFLAKTCGVAAINILLGPLSPDEEWLCWKKLFGISYKPIFNFFFGKTSENIISHMSRDVLHILNSIFCKPHLSTTSSTTLHLESEDMVVFLWECDSSCFLGIYLCLWRL